LRCRVVISQVLDYITVKHKNETEILKQENTVHDSAELLAFTAS